MLCQMCKAREATVKVTRVNNGIRQTDYLCEQCAVESGALNMFSNFGMGLTPPDQMSRVSRRLTERARMALGFAEQEARQRHSAYIDTEHILLGLFGVTDGLVPLPGERGPHRLRGAATVPSR